MGGDDFFGHIPRKKKDPPPSVGARMPPLPAPGVTTNDLPTIPRKRPVGKLAEATTSITEHMTVPRKKNVPPCSTAFKNQQPSVTSSTFNSGSGPVPAPPHKLDRANYDRKRQISVGHEQAAVQGHRASTSTQESQQQSYQLPQHQSRHDSPSSIADANLPGDNFRLVSNDRFRVISENPLVLKIKIHDIVMPHPRNRAIRQVVSGGPGALETKRQRPVYQELEDTDSDDFMTPEEHRELENRRQKKRLKKKSRKQERASASDDDIGKIPVSAGGEIQGTMAFDAPAPIDSMIPSGVISSVWYSREELLHLFVLDKVCGWRTRQKVSLYETLDEKQHDENKGGDEEGNSQLNAKEALVVLDSVSASMLHQRILSNADFYADSKIRMEVSRINPSHCPVVMTLAESLSQSSKSPSEANAWNATGKKYLIRVEPEREEVLLVKWRGRSYVHCSWERASDVQRLDPSTNFTARSKIKRYYQSQEMTLGPHWKAVIEEERKTAAAIHGHVIAEPCDLVETGPVDEYFSPQSLEVERILGCDEATMNMRVLAKQRAINIRNEQVTFERKEHDNPVSADKSPIHVAASSGAVNPYRLMIQLILNTDEHPWDPEDNVRYIVKWKGLPYVDMTWEYWRDIKRDAVDEVENFWYRQQAPDIDEASRLAAKPHPHVRDFKKLSESRAYGTSQRPRPIAVLDSENNEDLTSEANEDEGAEVDTGFRLRGYQLEGVNWLLFNWWNKRSCILADEMGLGKTIQSAAFLQELQSQPAAEVRGPFLIVAPLSLIGQWQSELASWAPDMNVVLYHGSADAREFLVKEEFYYTEQFVPKANVSKLKKLHITKFHVLITTFEVVLKDIGVLAKIKWRALLVDEAHRLKNSNSKLFEELAAVPRDYCVLLTGTPIANATEELWALLHFANPTVFADKDDFLRKFGEMTDAKQVNDLHNLLKPYLLRRVKEDVEKSLPPKEETILEVSLTPIQKTFYKAIYERNTAFLFKGAKPNNAPSLMNVMMELRKCCNHPFLVKGAEERILNDAVAKLKNRPDAQDSPVVIDHYKIFGEQLIKSCGKMVLMEKLLDKLFADGHKVLIFSQMVRVLDLLEELLKFKKYRYERLDGSTSSSSRVHAVERFKKPSLNRFVMLLSTRAGGLGLNLTAASVVIIYDSDWNPQNDLQAMARAHRIGQTKAVRVYRFLTAKTYEMHMFHSASLKLGLERAVLSQNREQANDGDENKSTRKSDKEAQAKEIDELLKKGAYDVFRDEDDKEGEQFMETDIDQLLAQSSKQITYGAGATSSLASGLGSFSKASFVANTEDGAKDVDLDDPEFWSKAVGLEAPEETPEDVAAMLDDGVKRSRKQVQVYDPYAETAEAEQRKKDKIAIEKQLEKEEKERSLLEKRKKKNGDKKKRRERDGDRSDKSENDSAKDRVKSDDKHKKKHTHNITGKDDDDEGRRNSDTKPKRNTKKSDKIRAIKRAEHEDPLIERIKQAWEAPHRNRASAATIRFGFGRFCKIRNESNLSSIPLQDVESFVSSYVYQVSLQFSVTILSRMHQNGNFLALRPLIEEWLGSKCEREVDWIWESVQSAVKYQAEVDSYRRFLRMPASLADPSFVADLRRGAALRALRRIGILNRLNCVIEEELDSILTGLGHEELGKRGCGVNELCSLDADLKARYVTTEELLLAVSASFLRLSSKPPASWWDRSCDVGLIVGSFIHGLGNYEAMRNDTTLPFAERIRKSSQHNLACKLAMQNFRIAASATRRAFDDALESARVKAELEVQAAVAAAAKAALKREEDAALLRKGGAEAEVAAKNMPRTQVENAFEFDGTDSHFVTLCRMHEYIQEALRKESLSSGSLPIEIVTDSSRREDDMESQDDGAATSGRMKEHHLLPMPDARVLDRRLVRVLEAIEAVVYGDEQVFNLPHPHHWDRSSDVQTNLEVRDHVLTLFRRDSADAIGEYMGVGLGASQCGTSHRSLNDGSDFSFGSASNQLSHVAYGTDAPRFLRAIGVPMNVTRFAIIGLAYSNANCVEVLLESEKIRNYGTCDNDSIQKQNKVKSESENSSELETVSSIASPLLNSMAPLPVDPVDLIPEIFRCNSRLRASVCLAVMFYGYPQELAQVNVDNDLWKSLLQESAAPDMISPPRLFDGTDFRDVVCLLMPDADVPSLSTLRHYIEAILLPHCLRLCISGNGPATRSARGSHGAYETPFGVSIHPEPSQVHPTPIPDPRLSLQEHSLEALGSAAALLRRVHLLRTCQFLCTEKSSDSIMTLARSSVMGQVSSMPVWWCPWIHDVALLIQAASGGLFSVLPNRNDHEIFSSNALQRYLYTLFVADERTLPAASCTPPEQITAWTERQANKFPSLNQIERRLSTLCSEATADVNHELRYHNLPMFDHGGWPRN